jgi:hypothetical protein
MTTNDDAMNCPMCFGTSREPIMHSPKWGRKIEPMPPCPDCGGTGKRPQRPVVKPVPIRSTMQDASRTQTGV